MKHASILRIVGGYAALAGAWIYGSDALLYRLWPDGAGFYRIGQYKGLAFVAVTSALLYGLLRAQMRNDRNYLEALEQSERRYRELFVANPHPMWVFDARSLAFLAVNDAALAHYGYSREEFLAMTIADIRPEEDVSRLVEWVEAVRGNHFRHSGRWRHRKKDGSLIEVEISSHALHFEGRPAKLILANDVTARLQAEREVQQLNMELERRVAQRTAALEAANRELESFSYSVSHDLRAPLRAVSGFAQILSKRHRERLEGQGAHYLDNILTASRRMEALIEDLLHYSRTGRGEIVARPVPLAPVVVHLRSTFAGRIAAEGARLEFIEPMPTPLGEARLIERALANLIDNALTYRRDGVAAEVAVWAAVAGSSVAIRVRDNGIGIPPEYREKIFEVFQRLHSDDAYPGTGIGLAIVRKAVRLMGGSVEVESEPSTGSTFVVTLPLAPSGPEEAV